MDSMVNGVNEQANKNCQTATREINNNARLDQKASFRVMLVLFVGLLMDLMAFAVILPLFPSLLDFYGKNDKVFLLSVGYWR